MNRKTHNRIAKRILKDTDPKIIERINNRMDGGGKSMPQVSPSVGRVPGLSNHGHRRWGHDLLTAGLIGFQEGGPKGLIPPAIHLALDVGRDQITKRYGSGVADLVEALINIGVDLDNKKKKKRKRRRMKQGTAGRPTPRARQGCQVRRRRPRQ
jgi:hypothetical protein